MTTELFVNTIVSLCEYIDKFDEIGRLTEYQWLEGPIGGMFDLFYDILIPGANDMVTEDFGHILFGSCITKEDIEDFYNEYKESLE